MLRMKLPRCDEEAKLILEGSEKYQFLDPPWYESNNFILKIAWQADAEVKSGGISIISQEGEESLINTINMAKKSLHLVMGSMHAMIFKEKALEALLKKLKEGIEFAAIVGTPIMVCDGTDSSPFLNWIRGRGDHEVPYDKEKWPFFFLPPSDYGKKLRPVLHWRLVDGRHLSWQPSHGEKTDRRFNLIIDNAMVGNAVIEQYFGSGIPVGHERLDAEILSNPEITQEQHIFLK